MKTIFNIGAPNAAEIVLAIYKKNAKPPEKVDKCTAESAADVQISELAKKLNEEMVAKMLLERE